MFILLSFLFNYVCVQAMLVPGTEGFQQTGLGTASTVCRLCEQGVQMCISHAATSPDLWQQFFSRDKAYVPAEGDLQSHDGTIDLTPPFQQDLDMDDTDENTSMLAQHTTAAMRSYPNSPIQNGEVMYEPSEAEIIYEDYQRQQEQQQRPSTPPNLWNLLSAASPPLQAGEFPSPQFSGRSPSPSSPGVNIKPNVLEERWRISPATDVNSLTVNKNNSNAVLPSFLNDLYNPGRRDTRGHWLDYVASIASTAFESEQSPPEPAIYPTKIPQGDLSPTDPVPVSPPAQFTPEILPISKAPLLPLHQDHPAPVTLLSKKHIYQYECDIHGLIFVKKELTMFVSSLCISSIY
jgi:hypothetical protein